MSHITSAALAGHYSSLPITSTNPKYAADDLYIGTSLKVQIKFYTFRQEELLSFVGSRIELIEKGLIQKVNNLSSKEHNMKYGKYLLSVGFFICISLAATAIMLENPYLFIGAGAGGFLLSGTLLFYMIKMFKDFLKKDEIESFVKMEQYYRSKLERMNNQLKEKIKSLEEKIDEDMQAINMLRKELTKARQNLLDKGKEIIKLNENIKRLESELGSLKQQLEKREQTKQGNPKQNDHQCQEAKLQKDLNELRKSYCQLSDDYDYLQEQLNILKTDQEELSHLRTEFQKIEAKNLDLKNAKNQSDEDISDRVKISNKLKQQLEEERIKREKAYRILEAFYGLVIGKEGIIGEDDIVKIQEMANQIESLQKEIGSMKEEKKRLEGKVFFRDMQLAQSNAKIAGLGTELLQASLRRRLPNRNFHTMKTPLRSRN